MRKRIFGFIVYLVLLIGLMACTESKEETYIIAFDTNGGSVIANITIRSGQTISLPTPQKDGFEFLGWYINPNDETTLVTNTNTISKNTTLVAKWGSRTFSVTFDGQEGVWVSGELTYTINPGNTLDTPPVFTKEGHVFAGWYDNSRYSGDPVQFPLNVNGNMTLYAKWEASSAISDASTFETAMTVQVSTSYYVFIGLEKAVYLKFIPTTSGKYSMQTKGLYDTYGVLYDHQYVYLDSDDDNGQDSNFKIIRNLIAGQTYYIELTMFFDTTDSGTVEFIIDPVTDDDPSGDSMFKDALLAELDVLYTIYIDLYEVKAIKFIPTVSGSYNFQTYGGYDTYGMLYDANEVAINLNDDGGDNSNFKINHYLIAGETYYVTIEMYYSDVDKGFVDFKIYQDVDNTQSNFDQATPVELNVTYSVFIDLNQVIYYKFTPTTSGVYTFKTLGDYDTYGRLFNHLYQLIQYNDDGGVESNFLIEYGLEGGMTYYIVFEMFFSSLDSGTVQFIITKNA